LSVAHDQRIERDEQVRCLSLAQPPQRRRVGDRVGQRCVWCGQVGGFLRLHDWWYDETGRREKGKSHTAARADSSSTTRLRNAAFPASTSATWARDAARLALSFSFLASEAANFAR
jgi:hypothetical protein